MSARRRKAPEQTLFAFAEEQDERRKGVDALFASVPHFRTPARFLDLLFGTAHFRAYAPYNAMLIHVQRPQARYVLPAARWGRYNRVVRRSANPLVILRPFSPVCYLYDLADTRVQPGCADRFPPHWAERPEDDPVADVSPVLLNRLFGRLPLWGVAHETVPTGPASAGRLFVADAAPVPDLDVKIGATSVAWPPVYVLQTRESAPNTDIFTALVHELARLFCRHVRCAYEKGWGAGREQTESAESFETLVATWLVCRRQQVASAAYADLRDRLSALDEIPDISFDAVLDAVAEIETMLGDCTVEDGFLYRHSPSFAAQVRVMRVLQRRPPAS